jgi:hypothetical protein
MGGPNKHEAMEYNAVHNRVPLQYSNQNAILDVLG